ncbi:hypothetical protein [Mesorhizobium sp. M0698]|uniref:hypothetical protein n=1 Tax=Mesorhizobium sp. M0698 TaxID=2956987 RepID=UPI003337946D
MIRIAIVVAIAASATACTSQANVPYSSKGTCKNYPSYAAFSGGGKWIKININACIPDTPNKSCMMYSDATGQTVIRCNPLTRKSATAEGRARQLAGSKYP